MCEQAQQDIIKYLKQGHHVLLEGPTGSGRSTVVQKISETSPLPVFHSSGGDLGRRYLKETRLASLLELEAEEEALLIVDDLDLLLSRAERGAFCELLEELQKRKRLRFLAVCHEFSVGYFQQEYFQGRKLFLQTVAQPLLDEEELQRCKPFARRLTSDYLRTPFALSVALDIDWSTVADEVETREVLRLHIESSPQRLKAFGHLAYEEWTYLHLLDTYHKECGGDTLTFASRISHHLRMRRAFRYWLREMVARKERVLSVYFMCCIRLPELPRAWVHDAMHVLTEKAIFHHLLQENRWELVAGDEPLVKVLARMLLRHADKPESLAIFNDFLVKNVVTLGKEFVERFQLVKESLEDGFGAVDILEQKGANYTDVFREWVQRLVVARRRLQGEELYELDPRDYLEVGTVALNCLRDFGFQLEPGYLEFCTSTIGKVLRRFADDWERTEERPEEELRIERFISRSLPEMILNAPSLYVERTLVDLIPVALTHSHNDVGEQYIGGADILALKGRKDLWQASAAVVAIFDRNSESTEPKAKARQVREQFQALLSEDIETVSKRISSDQKRQHFLKLGRLGHQIFLKDRPRVLSLGYLSEGKDEEPWGLTWAFLKVKRVLSPDLMGRWRRQLESARLLYKTEHWFLSDADDAFVGLVALSTLRDHCPELTDDERKFCLTILQKSLSVESSTLFRERRLARFEPGPERQLASCLGEMLESCQVEEVQDALRGFVAVVCTHSVEEVREFFFRDSGPLLKRSDPDLWERCLKSILLLDKFTHIYDLGRALRSARRAFPEPWDEKMDDFLMEYPGKEELRKSNLLEVYLKYRTVHKENEPLEPLPGAPLEQTFNQPWQSRPLSLDSEFVQGAVESYLNQWGKLLTKVCQAADFFNLTRDELDFALEVLFANRETENSYSRFASSQGFRRKFQRTLDDIPLGLFETPRILQMVTGVTLFADEFLNLLSYWREFHGLGFGFPDEVLLAAQEALAFHILQCPSSLKAKGRCQDDVLWLFALLQKRKSRRAAWLYDDYICLHYAH